MNVDIKGASLVCLVFGLVGCGQPTTTDSADSGPAPGITNAVFPACSETASQKAALDRFREVVAADEQLAYQVGSIGMEVILGQQFELRDIVEVNVRAGLNTRDCAGTIFLRMLKTSADGSPVLPMELEGEPSQGSRILFTITPETGEGDQQWSGGVAATIQIL